MASEIVCCVALGDAQVFHHLLPLARHPLVSRIWIIRHKKVDTGEILKAEYVLVPRFKPLRFLWMVYHCTRLAKRKEVRAFVSFNPIPYGLISNLPARFFNKAVHFGFIGTDWYRHADSKSGRWLLPILRKGSFITATGKSMRSEMIDYGFDPERISVLPHSINIDDFNIMVPEKAQYDCIFVGQLIHLKRVDVILNAFAKVVETNPQAKLCIVGKGPLSDKLKLLAQNLGVANSVDFVGYTNNVAFYLAKARIAVMASYREGFPFALVEAMCCGLVPVSTPAGTISDFITDGETGLIFEQNNIERLAECIRRLIEEPGFYNNLRNNVIELRNSFSYDAATKIWDRWLTTLT